MSEMTVAVPAENQPQSVEEFLGVEQKPRWRKWAKYWIPGVIVLLLALSVVTRRRRDGTNAAAQVATPAPSPTTPGAA